MLLAYSHLNSVHEQVLTCVCFDVSFESRWKLKRCIAFVTWTLVGQYAMGLFMFVMAICCPELFIAVSASKTYSWVVRHDVVVQTTLCVETLAAYYTVTLPNMRSWPSQAIALKNNFSWFCRFGFGLGFPWGAF